MEEQLLILIQNIQDRKTASGIAPVHVLRSEIDKAVSASLNTLFTDGRIEVGNTSNDKWIKIA